MLSSIDAVIQRTPLWRPEWRETLLRMREHPDSPRWNTECGDRLTAEDAAFVRRFEESLVGERRREPGRPPQGIIGWLAERRRHVRYIDIALGVLDPARDFGRIPTMDRADLQLRLEGIIPQGEPLDRLIINPTSGTTGQPILAPNHPRAIGCYDPLIQFCLRRHGVDVSYDHTMVAAVQACFQRHTIAYNTVHSYLGGAGFAKVNLDGRQWPEPGSPGRFLTDMEPAFVSGDPISFEELLRLGIGYRPKALLSCALALTPDLRQRLERAYGCPVVDFYSLNEAGPIACSRPDDPGTFQLLPNDIYIEIVDDEGRPLPDGQEGEICVTGGRNPFLPLLRYRTGDRGSLCHDHGHAGDPAPLLRLAGARQPVVFRLPSGGLVNPIDIGRILRRYPVSRHQCLQRKDLSLLVRLEGAGLGPLAEVITRELADLLEGEVGVTLEAWDFEGRGPEAPYATELR